MVIALVEEVIGGFTGAIGGVGNDAFDQWMLLMMFRFVSLLQRGVEPVGCDGICHCGVDHLGDLGTEPKVQVLVVPRRLLHQSPLLVTTLTSFVLIRDVPHRLVALGDDLLERLDWDPLLL